MNMPMAEAQAAEGNTPADPRPAADGQTEKGTAEPSAKGARERPEPLFATVEQWVIGWFAPVMVREHSRDFRWCPEWWRHAEVISRLHCLWETWEAARLQGGAAMSAWWRDHADYHLDVMTRAGGPFGQCNGREGHVGVGGGLPVVPAPPGTWRSRS